MKETITTEDLASMIKRGFDGVDARFDTVEDRLGRIESFLLADHKRRIEKLETEVKDLKEALAM